MTNSAPARTDADNWSEDKWLTFDESQTMWLDTVNKFMDNEITVEYVRKCDMNRDYPYEAYDKIAKQGWLGILIPEEEGGSGGDIFDYSLMAEGLGKFGFDFACSVLVPTFTAMNIIKFGTPEQKKNSCSRSLTARSVLGVDLGSMRVPMRRIRRRVHAATPMATGSSAARNSGAAARPRRTP